MRRDTDGNASRYACVGMVRNGGLAEFIRVPGADLFVTPKGIEPEVGASLFANELTALYALSARGKLQGGETLLVLAAAGGLE